MDVNIAFRRTYQPVPWFSDPQFVPGCQKRVEVVLLGRDVVHCDHDVDDWLGCQSRNRGGTDMFDLEVLTSQSITNPPPMIAISVRPFGVVAAEPQLQLLGATDELN